MRQMPSHTRHSRESIIAEARKERPDMGDGAMIAEGTWGYWVGASVYVDKEKLNKNGCQNHSKGGTNVPKNLQFHIKGISN